MVPRLKSCTAATRAIVPGAGAEALAPRSSAFDLAGVFVGCVGGKAQYFPVLVINGKEKDYSTVKVSPGDKVVLSLTGNSTSSAVSVVDKTHKSATEKRTGGGVGGFGAPAIFDWPWFLAGANEGPNLAGVPNFGTLHFSASKYAGTPLDSGTYSSSLAAYNRHRGLSKPGKLQIATKPFTSATSFTTVFKHS